MPAAGLSALAPGPLGLGPAKAFAVLRRDEPDTTLPVLHVPDLGGSSSSSTEDDDDDDDDSAASRLTAIRRPGRSNDASVFELLRPRSRSSEPGWPRLGRGPAACSRSLGQLARAEPLARGPHHLSADDFGALLRAKLRRVQQQDEEQQRREAAGRARHALHPRPFVSTVRSGEFLRPPPELALLLGIGPGGPAEGPEARSRIRQQLSSLGRRPEVRHRAHHAKCPVALKAFDNFAFGSTFEPPASGPRPGARTAQPDNPPPFGNLMFDRRVVRGSTFAAAPVLMCNEQSQAARQADARRRQVLRKRAQLQSTRSALVRIATPPPVPGRRHEPVQTELFLEELFEKPDESDVAVQTDYFLDRPATPPFCLSRKGQDASTQIEPGDLFDYDVEVQPILEVLVGKTIEQALIEVLEEEEIATLREQQRKFLELRASEKAEQQRLEEQDRRLREEKDRRLRQHEEAVKTQQETEERVAAAVLLTGYIAELLPAVLEGLKISGFLLDEIKADVEEGFMPWLMKEVKKEMGTVIESKEILEEIVKEIIENRAKTYSQLGEEYDASRKSAVDDFASACEMDEEEEHVDEVSMTENDETKSNQET